MRLGVRQSTFIQLQKRYLKTPMAQYWGIVQDGLMLAQRVHLFRGLNRDMLHGGDVQADEHVLVYSWEPSHDCVWEGPEFEGMDGGPVWRPRLVGRVFVILARPFSSANHGVIGELLHWNWVEEAPDLMGAPDDWRNRYRQHVWSRTG